MNKVIQGNLLLETTGILVHGCNAQGVMGSGIAAGIKKLYPQVFKDYRDYYERMSVLDHKSMLGTVVTTQIKEDLFIVSGITQFFYGRKPYVCYVDYDAIRSVFKQVRDLSITTNLPVKYPKIGAGLGNGDFTKIKLIIDNELQDVVEHTLYVQ